MMMHAPFAATHTLPLERAQDATTLLRCHCSLNMLAGHHCSPYMHASCWVGAASACMGILTGVCGVLLAVAVYVTCWGRHYLG